MSTAEQIIVFPVGSLDPKTKERMSKASILYIEVEDPSKVVMLTPSSNVINGDQMLRCALGAIAKKGDWSLKAEFFDLMWSSIHETDAAGRPLEKP